jgi:hypothetical protein
MYTISYHLAQTRIADLHDQAQRDALARAAGQLGRRPGLRPRLRLRLRPRSGEMRGMGRFAPGAASR